MERRTVHRLLMHWRGAQQSDQIPEIASVFARDFGDIEPNIYVLDIRGDGPVFERIGSNLLADWGKGLVGEPVSDAPKAHATGTSREILL